MLLKYEKNYELLKRIERENDDAQLRADRENKTSQQQIRRLEQENDDLANEFINYRIGLNKKHDQLKDANDNLQMEINKIKVRSCIVQWHAACTIGPLQRSLSL
jgi:hypothetical protein